MIAFFSATGRVSERFCKPDRRSDCPVLPAPSPTAGSVVYTAAVLLVEVYCRVWPSPRVRYWIEAGLMATPIRQCTS